MTIIMQIPCDYFEQSQRKGATLNYGREMFICLQKTRASRRFLQTDHRRIPDVRSSVHVPKYTEMGSKQGSSLHLKAQETRREFIVIFANN